MMPLFILINVYLLYICNVFVAGNIGRFQVI